MRMYLFTYRFILAALLMSSSLFAQQVPATDLYFNNLFFVNPAKAGDAGTTQLAVFNRRQWTGIEGAPVTSFLSLDLPVKGKIGLGFNFVNDQINFLRTSKASLAGKYKLQVAKDHFLSLGIQASMYDSYLNFANAKVDDYSDAILTLGPNNHALAMGVDFGLNYQFKNLEVGLYHTQMFNTSDKAYFKNNLNSYRLQAHYGGYASYNFNVNQDFSLQPRLGLRYLPGVFIQGEIGAMLDFKNKFGIGAMYRTQEAMSMSFKYKASDLFTFYYSYGAGLQGISAYSGGTHEFLVLITFKKEIPKEEMVKKELQLDSLVLAVKKLNDKNKALDSLNSALEDRVGALEAMQVKYLDSLQIIQLINDKLPATDVDDSLSGNLHVGERYVIENIHFEFNSYVIKAESKPILDNVVFYLNKYPKVKIEVDGHTDYVGSNAANMTLSYNRAKAVCKYLTDHGIASSRLSYKGYGELSPVATNKTDKGRAKNRRIEFIILAR
jgi:type IX secretion system PorP/SprF family membrane protein